MIGNPTMPLTTELLHPVPYHECDVYQIVRDACYLRLMQEAAFAASAAVGYDDARYQTMRRVWLIRESLIDFIQPLRYGDQVRITHLGGRLSPRALASGL
jgi:YbgC/YbaW family acyl-CoA thioester hydrolase